MPHPSEDPSPTALVTLADRHALPYHVQRALRPHTVRYSYPWQCAVGWPNGRWARLVDSPDPHACALVAVAAMLDPRVADDPAEWIRSLRGTGYEWVRAFVPEYVARAQRVIATSSPFRRWRLRHQS